MLNFAVELLKNDNVVSIPTETVYGLAGSIYSDIALRKIFSIKKRPFFDPLIVHVSSIEEAKCLVKKWNPAIELIAKSFWPGPITLVLEKNSLVSDLITSGLKTVAIRIPNHLMALELIQKCGFPLAAPSANRFGKTSPSTAQHVKDEFPLEDIQVIDGGPCLIGLESTVLSIEISEDNTLNLSVLRKGSIKLSEITSILKEHGFSFNVTESFDLVASPGQMKHHYMPNKSLIILDEIDVEDIAMSSIRERLTNLPVQIEYVSIIKPDKIDSFKELILSNDPILAARELYSKLRESCLGNEDIIIFKMKKYHKDNSWEAVLERLLKAATLVLNS